MTHGHRRNYTTLTDATAVGCALDVADWNEFVLLTRRHRVETLSWRGLVAQVVPVPADVHARLRSRAMAVAARNLRMRAQCDALLVLFAAHDVEVVTLKGGMLGAALYGDDATKTSLDIDLLVPAASLEQAISLLEAQGYRHVQVKTRLDSRQIEVARNLGKELCFVQRETGWVVDLHGLLSTIRRCSMSRCCWPMPVCANALARLCQWYTRRSRAQHCSPTSAYTARAQDGTV